MDKIRVPVEAGSAYVVRGRLGPDVPPVAPVGAALRPLAKRGTTNGNERGGSDDRRKRREWLVMTFRADVDLAPFTTSHIRGYLGVALGLGMPACRCYRCGKLLTVETVSADRIKPGCQGGTYARNNIRPACVTCNSITGGSTRGKRAR